MIATLRRLLKRLSTVRRPRRNTLSLESLEDRCCPSTDVWTGAGSAPTVAHPNDNWSNPLNWQAQVAPLPGDALDFAATAPYAKLSNNNYAAGTVFNSIKIETNGYQITGNAVQLQNGIENVAGLNTVGLPLTLTAAQTFADDSGNLTLTGSINNGGNLLTVNTSGNVLFCGPSITGAGGLVMIGNGGIGKFFLEDSAPDSYTGVTTVLGGEMYLDGAAGNSIVGNLVIGGVGPNQQDIVRLTLGNQIASTVHVAVNPDGLLDLNGFNDAIGPLTMTGGYVITGSGMLTLDGNVTTLASATTAVIEGAVSLGTVAGPRTFTVASGTTTGADLDFKAVISGAGMELVKAGLGAMRLDTDNSYSGQTLVSAGTLTAASTNALGTAGVTVSSGAALEYVNGSGTPDFSIRINGNLTNAGVVEFDGAGAVGALTLHGNYSQAASGALDMALANTNAFDQVTISGAASLAGAFNVNLTDGFQPAGGNQFKIMTFGSSSGSFGTVNLPRPRVLSLLYDPRDLTIVDTASVTGGGGTLPPGTDVWTGAGANDNWSNPLNWAAHVAPSPGDSLIFPSAAAATVSCNDYAPGTAFASITIAGSGYQIGGHDVMLLDGLTADNSSGFNTVSLPLSLAAPAIITDANPGATLILAGSVNNGGNLLTVNADGPILFNGPSIGGAGGLTVEGSGVFTLADTAADSYTGPTEVLSGTLAIANAGALSSVTTVDAGGTLQVQGVTIGAGHTLNLNGFGVNGAGALQDGSGNGGWNGTISLASNTAIGSSAGTTLTIGAGVTSTVISGPFTSNLLFVGSGTVVLAAADSYEGYTTVAGGVLALENANALVGAPIYGGRGTAVDAGATLQLRQLPAGVAYALNPLALNGSGVGGAGALQNLAGDNVWQGPIDLHSAATITSAAGSSLTTKAAITNEGYLLTVNAVGDVDMASIFSGAGGLTKNGAGTLTFSDPAPNLYAGPTVINAGTLMVTKAASVQAIGGAGLTIEAGATLAGSGLIDADVTNYGTVSPGGQGAIGTLTIDGNYTQIGGILDIEVESTKAIDQLMISGVATLGGTLEVCLLDGFQPTPGERFTFMTFGSRMGQFGTLDLPSDLSLVYDPQDATLVAH